MCKNWAQRLYIGGKVTNLGQGSYPVVTLAAGREKAVENVRDVSEGADPRTPFATNPTFADAVDSVIALHSEGWKNPRL